MDAGGQDGAAADGSTSGPGSSAAGGIRTQVRVSVVPLTCARCKLPVPAGQRHLRHVDTRAVPAVSFVECAECARRAGRSGPLDARPEGRRAL
ncbi:hypothetical protein [Quadrisphaera sp. INWT6]|uniref:hypothetical protein n=1 Tax=Quadrisphaera sp. INWT6 TaxID=2596917 RepID=UPI0018926902|nr:hypothetical protein [Quadrisphaera sp. INWT6]MBF5083218.1 hypothetical protein [Quadrisphaera sp. INWT6]